MTQELPEGTVTVLFTDVVGSTELTNRLGDEAAREVLGACDDLVRQQADRHRGREVKGTGDGLMLAFTSARRAIACAVDTQRAMAERNRRDPSRTVGLRIGLNTGEVIREEGDLFGAMVTAAARIADHASAGEILISDTVKGLLGPATTVELEERGQVELGGFPQPWRVHAVRWEEKAAAPAYMERTPFVGREAERAELRRLLEQSLRGQGALVMIGGEPGVGKTRLAEELAAEARERGALALVGHCYEMEGAPPYIPFVEVLESAARAVPSDTFRSALGDAAPEVAKLMPELRRLFPDIPPPLELPPEQERHYLFNSMREFIERAARPQPLLLVLEDLHWADDSTLLLLQHIAQQLHQMPVLVVGTYRDVELDVARPLARTLEDLVRQRLALDMALKRLPESGVEAILRGLSRQQPPARLVEAVYGETEGNPFFVEEVYQHLSQEGKLFDAEGRWRADLRVGELDVPRGVRLVIGRRLERVSEDCRRVLTTAAVIGRSFTFELLEALGDPSTSSGQAPSAGSGQGAETDALLDAVDEAERAHLITATSDGREARFAFAHELIRQTLASGLSLPRRQRVHLRVAEAMERVYATALSERASDLAHHLYQAGSAADPEKTVRYLALAGEQALGAAAFEEALRNFENALSLESAEPRARAALLYGRGRALTSLGRWDEGLADWQQALDLYEQLGDTETVGLICWELSDQLDWAWRLPESLETARRGLAAVGEAASRCRCRLLALAGCVEGLLGQYAPAERLTGEALRMSEELGDERLLGEALMYRMLFDFCFLRPRESAAAGVRAADLLRSAGSLWDLCALLSFSQMAHLWLGRAGDADKIGRELEPLATRLGHLGALLFARRNLALTHLMRTGDIDAFHEFAKADLELCRSASMPWISDSYVYLAMVDFWRGRWEQALENLQEAVRLEMPGGSAGDEWSQLFVAKAYAGLSNEALAMLRQRADELPRSGQPNAWGVWLMLFAAVEGLAVLGERDECGKLYPLVLEAINAGAVTTWWNRPLQTFAGIAAAAGGRWEEAEQHFQMALHQAHELPVVIEQPEVRRWYAWMLLDRDGPGDRAKARALLEEAIAMYREIGMPKHVELAEEMVKQL